MPRNQPQFYDHPDIMADWNAYRRKMDCWIVDRTWYYNNYLTQVCIELENKIMAAKPQKSPAKPKGKQSWEVTFVNVQLTSEHRAELAQWPMTPDEQMDYIGSMVESGYKQSWSYNASNGNHTFTLTCRAEGHPNDGLAVSAFGKTYFQAIKGLVFKLDMILPEFWNEYRAAEGDEIG